MTEMTGKVAVVNGETQGLGTAIAALFAMPGASSIVICGRSREKGTRRGSTRHIDLIK
jgi:NAD(P)-dependent dehydrogenase (short-subunit alcohol dehydrogenase family)